jgi:hypothetical protein
MYDADIQSMDAAKGARSWMAPQVSTGLFMTPQHKSRYGVLYDRCDTNDSECFKAKS